MAGDIQSGDVIEVKKSQPSFSPRTKRCQKNVPGLWVPEFLLGGDVGPVQIEEMNIFMGSHILGAFLYNQFTMISIML